MSVAVFTSRAEKWVCEGREEDTSEVRFEGEMEQRFRLKVTDRGVGGSFHTLAQSGVPWKIWRRQTSAFSQCKGKY